jgi:transposase
VLAHAKQVRAISHARVKTDKVDAKVLADLLAGGLIPKAWIGDERTRMTGRASRPRWTATSARCTATTRSSS